MDTVIVPTYNEAENVGELITRLKVVCDCNILVVDDSKDKNATADTAHEAGAQVIQRTGKRGLSSAVIDGLETLNNVTDKVVVMDADLQHPPEDVPKLFEALDKHDFVVASRYIPGGGCNGWDFDRKVISRTANLLARPLAPKVHDLVSGFFGFRREGLPDLSSVNDKGFKIMLELLVRGNWKSVVEVPFIFQLRLRGDTKMKFSQIRDYALQLANLYLARLRRRI